MGLELLRSRGDEFGHPLAAPQRQSGQGAGRVRAGCRQGAGRAVQRWCAPSVASPGLGVGGEGPGQGTAAGRAPHISVCRGCGAGEQRASGWPPSLHVPAVSLRGQKHPPVNPGGTQSPSSSGGYA